MGDFIKALPAIGVMLVSLVSLAFGIFWMIHGNEPYGPGGTLGALALYLVTAFVFLRLFTY